MNFYKVIGIPLLVITTSLYLFPFEFTFLSGMNTKKIMAGIGLVWLGFNLARGGNSHINRDILVLSLWAVAVSFFGFIAVTFNGTSDYTYVTYVISMWVWLGGAYTATQLIKCLHGYLSVRLICHYFIAVCVAQCVIAFAMDQSQVIKMFVDSFLAGEGFMGRVEGRLYGIGASLDVGGMRFSAALLIIAYLGLNSNRELSLFQAMNYVVSFIIIIIVGNMIGRTTTVGAIMSIAYWGYMSLKGSVEQRSNLKLLMLCLACTLIVSIPIVWYLYRTNPSMHENIRFAFEGFFSLVEQGRWETHSNEILKNMYVFPDNLKTWFVGDGYIENPYGLDPYYTGPHWHGYYQGTDVGYLRFIFYFGVLGLLSFIIYMCKVAHVCICRFRGYGPLFFLILMLNFIIWFKVASDLFLVFAIFLCIAPSDKTETVEEKKLYQ